MFSSTFELITLAASNSLFPFCFCNLIIVILFIGSSKPDSQLDDEEIATPPPMVANTNENDTITSYVNCSVAQSEDEEIVAIPPLMVANTNENDMRTPDVNCSVTKKNTSTDRDSSEKSYIDVVIVNSGDEGNDDYEDDELRKRVEEFI